MRSATPVAQPRWAVLQSATGVRAGLNFGPQQVTSAEGKAWLAAQFDSTLTVPVPDFYLGDDLRTEVEVLLGDDLRETGAARDRLATGAARIRNALITAYQGTCCVTGYQTESVLEAAHISRYKGHHTNDVTNGLLLRADVHTLFDRHLLTVTSYYKTRVAPALNETPYAHYDARPLPLPSRTADRPSTSALKVHNADCAWLEPSETVLF